MSLRLTFLRQATVEDFLLREATVEDFLLREADAYKDAAAASTRWLEDDRC